MNIKNKIKNIISFLSDQNIEIRIRLMFFLQYAVLVACTFGTVAMILLKQPFVSMISNIVLFIMSFVGLYITHVKKNYDLATFILILGCANMALPLMFFSAGGNDSGMNIWLLFSVIVTCLMSKGKIRIFMSIITIIEDIACICIGHFLPETVTPLIGNDAVFYDVLQSYAIVCIFLATMLIIYISTYDSQRQKLEMQSEELRMLIQLDSLTGLYNRRAYYNQIYEYKNSNQDPSMVLVAMDVNGLKKVNDTYGHAVGDEYICEASRVIQEVLNQYGTVFRTGGDEFMAILHCTVDEANTIDSKINECIKKSKSKWNKEMAIAVGVVCCKDNPDMDMYEIEKMADQRMYENKSAYYRRTGIDRRK